MTKNESRTPILIPVDDLIFDPKNPRLPSTRAASNEAEVLRYMLDKGNITELMLSIATQGYFDGEPLLVIPSDNKKGKFEVVEGNRRLAALKLLHDPNLAPIKEATIHEIVAEASIIPEKAPALVYNERSEIIRYLGYRHITGIKDWDSLAKAKYLSELYNVLPSNSNYRDKLRELAKIIGSRSDYVHKLLSGFEAYKIIESNEFYNIPSLDEENFSFSLLTTATSYSGIAEFVGFDESSEDVRPEHINNDHLKELTEWIFRENQEGITRLRESRNLRYLNAIVTNPIALKEFRNDTPIEMAWQHTSGPAEFFARMLSEAFTNLSEANKQMHQVERYQQDHFDVLNDITQMSRNMRTVVQTAIADQED